MEAIRAALTARALAGPPGKSEADTRLAALKAHQRGAESAPGPDRKKLIEALLPIVIAQGIDFLSTEKPLGFNKRDDMYEANNRFPGAKSPGFAGTMGRVGSGVLELALAAALAKKFPRAANAYAVPSASTHVQFAKDNWAEMRRNELKGPR